jgi:hypothetical protein
MLSRIAVLALLLVGCPTGGGDKLTDVCTHAYDKCMQPNGVLGVCDVVECAQGQPEPCLTCRSQH